MANKTMGKTATSSWWEERSKILAEIARPARPKARKVKAKKAAKAKKPAKAKKTKVAKKTTRAKKTKTAKRRA